MKVYKKSLSHNEKKTFPVVEKKIYILPHMVYDTLMCQNSVRRVKNWRLRAKTIPSGIQ
jgi:hypothetical protein